MFSKRAAIAGAVMLAASMTDDGQLFIAIEDSRKNRFGPADAERRRGLGW